MKYDVDWHFFLVVTNQKKCDKMIQKIADLLGIHFSEVTAENYWKDEALFKVSARSTFVASSYQEALDLTMKMIKRIAPTWIVTIPSDQEPWEFGGTTSPGAVQLQGVNSISFNVSQVQQEGLAEAV